MKKMITSDGSFEWIKLIQAVDLKSPVENKKTKLFFFTGKAQSPARDCPHPLHPVRFPLNCLSNTSNDERKI
jgi:hypothetical protein